VDTRSTVSNHRLGSEIRIVRIRFGQDTRVGAGCLQTTSVGFLTPRYLHYNYIRNVHCTSTTSPLPVWGSSGQVLSPVCCRLFLAAPAVACPNTCTPYRVRVLRSTASIHAGCRGNFQRAKVVCTHLRTPWRQTVEHTCW
jgi:hypothetical protein